MKTPPHTYRFVEKKMQITFFLLVFFLWVIVESPSQCMSLNLGSATVIYSFPHTTLIN